jgi:A/G-specific adenine glycosylase
MWLKAQALLPSENIGSYTQGLMDLGATLCTRSSPQCSICPMQARCIAHAQGRTAELPTRKPKKTLKEKQVLMLIMLDEGRVLLEQRPNSGIWGGLLSLPEFDGMREINSVVGDRPVSTQLIKSNAENRHHEIVRYVSRFGDAGELSYLSPFTHVFTHFKLHIQPVLVPLFQRDLAVGEETYTWLNLSDVENAALPAPVKALLLTL